MVVFPEESKFYTRWQHDMESRGVKVCTKVLSEGDLVSYETVG